MSTDTDSHMYKDTKTWSPFVGCQFDCTYCEVTFKRQLKRRKKECMMCFEYEPHYHPSRLKLSKIPSKKKVFVCASGDVAFCHTGFFKEILALIKKHKPRIYTNKTFYFQSKYPKYFGPFLSDFPDNVILGTTLETNRDEGYSEISKAPPPSVRMGQFLALEYPRKYVTIEPVMDFDHTEFVDWITEIAPEYVWLGFNSKPDKVELPEPLEEKLEFFMRALLERGIEVKGKTLRGITLLKDLEG